MTTNARAADWADFYALKRAHVRGYARRWATPRMPAEDLIQHAMLRALEGRCVATSTAGRMSWLWIVIRNHALNASREHGRQIQYQQDVSIARAGERSNRVAEHGRESNATVVDVLDAIAALPDVHRRAVTMLASGASMREIADAEGCSLGCAKTRVWRARRALAKVIR